MESPTDDFNPDLAITAERVAAILKSTGHRVVFAESCTAGLLSWSLSQIPGISEFLCGSAVTYRNATKSAWLKVDKANLDDPKIGPVSELVADAMCRGVLQNTPEADWAVSITGHLGPHAPKELDGVVFSGVMRRNWSNAKIQRHQLDQLSPDPLQCRHKRQIHAAIMVLESLATAMKPLSDDRQ